MNFWVIYNIVIIFDYVFSFYYTDNHKKLGARFKKIFKRKRHEEKFFYIYSFSSKYIYIIDLKGNIAFQLIMRFLELKIIQKEKNKNF